MPCFKIPKDGRVKFRIWFCLERSCSEKWVISSHNAIRRWDLTSSLTSSQFLIPTPPPVPTLMKETPTLDRSSPPSHGLSVSFFFFSLHTHVPVSFYSTSESFSMFPFLFIPILTTQGRVIRSLAFSHQLYTSPAQTSPPSSSFHWTSQQQNPQNHLGCVVGCVAECRGSFLPSRKVLFFQLTDASSNRGLSFPLLPWQEQVFQRPVMQLIMCFGCAIVGKVCNATLNHLENILLSLTCRA